MRDIGTRYNLCIYFIDGGIVVFPGKVKAVQHYRGIPPPPSGNPLVFSKDEAFQLLAKGVWWEGRKNDVEGFFPPKCVEELSVSSQLLLPKNRILLRVLLVFSENMGHPEPIKYVIMKKCPKLLRINGSPFLWESITAAKNSDCSQGLYGDQLQVSKMMVVLRVSNILMVQN